MADYNYDESKRTEKMAKNIAVARQRMQEQTPYHKEQYDPEMQYVKGECLKNVLKVSENDMVKKPAHYTKGEIECIDAMRASMSKEAFSGYCKGNVIKYVWRYETKGAGLEDLKKAQVYLKWLMEEAETQEDLNAWLTEIRGGQ